MNQQVQTPADADAKAHVLVVDMAEDTLSDEHHHHLGRVLRLRSGDPVTVTNGKGSWRVAALGSGWPNRSDLEWTSEVMVVARRLQPVAVGFALTKGDKPETVVQKLAELGVDRIVPFMAEHSVAKWDSEKAARNVARLRVIAGEALQQSRQTWLSEVSEMTSFAKLVGSPAEAVINATPSTGTTETTHPTEMTDTREFGFPSRADRGGKPLLLSSTRFVLVGPEGGWSDAERALLPDAVGIAWSVLRAETAAIVTGALLVQRSAS